MSAINNLHVNINFASGFYNKDTKAPKYWVFGNNCRAEADNMLERCKAQCKK